MSTLFPELMQKVAASRGPLHRMSPEEVKRLGKPRGHSPKVVDAVVVQAKSGLPVPYRGGTSTPPQGVGKRVIYFLRAHPYRVGGATSVALGGVGYAGYRYFKQKQGDHTKQAAEIIEKLAAAGRIGRGLTATGEWLGKKVERAGARRMKESRSFPSYNRGASLNEVGKTMQDHSQGVGSLAVGAAGAGVAAGAGAFMAGRMSKRNKTVQKVAASSGSLRSMASTGMKFLGNLNPLVTATGLSGAGYGGYRFLKRKKKSDPGAAL